jgi:AAA ATPase domain
MISSATSVGSRPSASGGRVAATTRSGTPQAFASGRGTTGERGYPPSAHRPPDRTTTVLLEREDQVAALQALAGAAQRGGGRLVVIEGSAGIGKSRLLAEARAVTASAGSSRASAYRIVRQLFEPLLASVSSDLRAELLSGHRDRSVEPSNVSLGGGSGSAPMRSASVRVEDDDRDAHIFAPPLRRRRRWRW